MSHNAPGNPMEGYTPQDSTHRTAVVIGRMQPPHWGHIRLIVAASKRADSVVVVLGTSSYGPTNANNPWSFGMRKVMLAKALAERMDKPIEKLHIIEQVDIASDDEAWARSIQQAVAGVTGATGKQVCLFGYHKDVSSYYLDLFKQWDYVEEQRPVAGGDGQVLHSTDVRKAIRLLQLALPPEVVGLVHKGDI